MKKMFKILLLSLVSAIQTPLERPDHYSHLPHIDLDGNDAMGVRQTIFEGKQASTLTGGHDTCFLASVSMQNQTFIVRVDTGSTDTVLRV